ncbi:MAG: hemin-degrading factor, partial [Kiritimatiellae bacterium]|nr:hemin-degrading factor [Kiritimatiellia bacterium]
MTTSTGTLHPLRQRWLAEPEQFAGLRQIDIAEALGVSEGEWVHACCGHESVQLESDPKRLLQGLPAVGTVMALTRNPNAVHEKIGCYDHIHFFDNMGMAHENPQVDLVIHHLRHS